MAWQKPTSLNDWLGIILRHKKKFFFPAVAVMICVIWASQWVPREWFAEGKFTRQNDPAMVTMQGDNSVNMQHLNIIRRQLNEDIKGRAAVEQLARDLKLDQGLARAPDGSFTREGQLAFYDLVNGLRGRVNVFFQDYSDHADVVVVTFTADNPEIASKVVNQTIENYIRKTRDQLNEMLLNAKTFFEREVARYATKVQELESKKLRFELDNPGLDPDDPASSRARLVELRSKLDVVTQELSIIQARRQKLEDLIKAAPDMIQSTKTGQNPELAELLNKKSVLDEAYEQHRAMGRRDIHPEVQKVLLRLTELNEQIDGMAKEAVIETIETPNTAKFQAMADLESLSGTMLALERRRDELGAEVEHYAIIERNFFVIRNEYLRIERELAEASQQLTFWDNNLRRTSTAVSTEVSNQGIRLSITQRAPDLGKPTKPTLWGILSMAVFLGVASGVVLVALAELLDSSFHSVDQAVDNLKLPVLGAVNEIITPSEALRQRVLSWGLYPTAGAVMVVVLLVSFALTYYSLQNPLKYDQIMKNPGAFIEQTLGIR